MMWPQYLKNGTNLDKVKFKRYNSKHSHSKKYYLDANGAGGYFPMPIYALTFP
jgi:hypothetical protein